MPENDVPRYLPQRDLPPYSFVGGGPYPHPRRDSGGHSHGEPEPDPDPLDPGAWRDSEAYLRGIDLFNNGYYWEAHEQWEALWHASGRRGPVAEFAKGLIKLTAAGVKARQGRVRGVRRHASRAAGHFRRVMEETASPGIAGLDLYALVEFAEEVGQDAEAAVFRGKVAGTTVVFDQKLEPR
jgi:hypothetical protein